MIRLSPDIAKTPCRPTNTGGDIALKALHRSVKQDSRYRAGFRTPEFRAERQFLPSTGRIIWHSIAEMLMDDCAKDTPPLLRITNAKTSNTD